MAAKDTFFTITKPAEGAIFKDKNSKFLGFAFPIKNEDDVKRHVDSLKKQYYAARHWCYAYQIGTENKRYRANDDGEPNNSAGMPIYGQIQSFDVTNTLVVVVRYYGGVKLGVGGLIHAYRTAAQWALDASDIVEKTINQDFQLQFDYKYMSKVMRILKEHDTEIVSQKLELDCLLEISVRKSKALFIMSIFKDFHGVSIKEL